jgi:predicted Fe-Mo cluster-binding NifX family protein
MGKIAVASKDGIRVDTHFGQANQFRVYEIQDDGSFEFLEIRSRESEEEECPQDCGSGGCGGHHSQQFDISLIEDCQFVLVAKIGMHAQQFLARNGITAFDVQEPIDSAIQKVIDYHARLAARKRLQLEQKEKEKNAVSSK